MTKIIKVEENGYMANDLLFAKVKPNAIIPTKKEENAGYDIYACFDENTHYLVIPPQETILVPTGIASAMNNNYYLQVEERGSTGSKGIKKSAGVIDSSYRGEIFIALTNTNSVPIVINKDIIDPNTFDELIIVYPYTKAIAQLIVHEVPKMQVKEISYDKLKSIPSDRGCGILGSSGK